MADLVATAPDGERLAPETLIVHDAIVPGHVSFDAFDRSTKGSSNPVKAPEVGHVTYKCQRCPECGEGGQYSEYYEPVSDLLMLNPTAAKYPYFGCCFVMCLGEVSKYDPTKNHPVLSSNKCKSCYRCTDHCNCATATQCGHKVLHTKYICVDDVCNNCCSTHTFCAHCGRMHDVTRVRICRSCDQCDRAGCSCDDHDGDCDCKKCWTPTEPDPWTARGIYVEDLPIQDINLNQWKQIDPVTAMAHFYLLSYFEIPFNMGGRTEDADWGQGLLNDALIEYNAIVREAQTMRDELVRTLDKPFFDYLDYAIGGEIRHHRNIGRDRVLTTERVAAWGQWRSLRERAGVDAIKDAANLFRDGTMRDGFGGENWAVAADILHARAAGTLEPWLFVDRVFTLEHNNGCILNKVGWREDHKSRVNVQSAGYLAYCRIIGDAHAAAEPDLELLLYFADEKVGSLFSEWWKARNRVLRTLGQPMLVKPNYWDRIQSRPKQLRGSKYVVFSKKSGRIRSERDYYQEFAFVIDSVDRFRIKHGWVPEGLESDKTENPEVSTPKIALKLPKPDTYPWYSINKPPSSPEPPPPPDCGIPDCQVCADWKALNLSNIFNQASPT